MASERIIVRSRKYDLTLRRTWTCELIGQQDGAWTFVGVFDRDVEHSELGSISRGTVSYEYYWPDRWYNIFRFHEPDGRFRNYYCNINLPPTFEDGFLDYVDLDVDIVVWPDLRFEILDWDEFEENSVRFDYPDEIVENVQHAVAELTGMIARAEFPFAEHHLP